MDYTPTNPQDASWVGQPTYGAPTRFVPATWGASIFVAPVGFSSYGIAAPAFFYSQTVYPPGFESFLLGPARVARSSDQYLPGQYSCNATWYGRQSYVPKKGDVFATWSLAARLLPLGLAPTSAFGAHRIATPDRVSPPTLGDLSGWGAHYILRDFEYKPGQYTCNATWVGQQPYHPALGDQYATWSRSRRLLPNSVQRGETWSLLSKISQPDFLRPPSFGPSSIISPVLTVHYAWQYAAPQIVVDATWWKAKEYKPQDGDKANGVWGVQRGELFLPLVGWQNKSFFGTATIDTWWKYVEPVGQAHTRWGMPNLRLGTRSIDVPGIYPPSQTEPLNRDRQVPNPSIIYRNSYVSLSGQGIATGFYAPPTHSVTHWYQRVDQAAMGVNISVLGTATVTFKTRWIEPVTVLGSAWGTPVVGRRLFVTPAGWDSSFISENHELLVNTRRVYPHMGSALPTEWGEHTLILQYRFLGPKGWDNVEVAFPEKVFNRNRVLAVAPFGENVDPTTWTHYYPYVNNVIRPIGAFGHQSSRVGNATWIHNAGRPLLPAGQDFTLWGPDTVIADRVRKVWPEGWDSFYNERYTIVYNNARVVGPASAGDTSLWGRPNPVFNLNREVKHHSGWLGYEFGTAFIADRVRYVAPDLFFDVTLTMPVPEVRFNPYPIAPEGVPPLGQVGGASLRIYKATAYVFSVNVHDPWFGEATVVSRNKTLYTFGRDTSELPRFAHDVQNRTRYITPVWREYGVPEYPDTEPVPVDPVEWGLPLIGDRTKHVYPAPTSLPVFSVLHRLKRDGADPPATQQVSLYTLDQQGNFYWNGGIGPTKESWYAYAGTPFVGVQQIWVSSIQTGGYGRPTLTATSIRPRFIFEDQLFGTPFIIGTQYLKVAAWQSADSVVSEGARFSPWHIFAPEGDQTPDNYRPRKGITQRMDEGIWTTGPRWPFWGQAEISNFYRTIGPVPNHGAWTTEDFVNYPKFGNAVLTLKHRVISMNGMRLLRFGQVIILDVPQWVRMDDPAYPNWVQSHEEWGSHRIGPPPSTDKRQWVYPKGLDTWWGANRIELFNRQIYPVGVAHTGNPQIDSYNTTPWGTAMVGYPRKYLVTMGVVTRWGTHIIEYKNRPVYPVGWVNTSLEDGNYDDFEWPMKIMRMGTSRAEPPSIVLAKQFGGHFVSNVSRGVLARGIYQSAVGKHTLKNRAHITFPGWDSLIVGNIDRWEAGKIKPHGDDLSALGRPRLLHPVRPPSVDVSVVPPPRIAPSVRPISIQPIAFVGPSVTNPFGCTNRIVSPLPVLSTQRVPNPVVV